MKKSIFDYNLHDNSHVKVNKERKSGEKEKKISHHLTKMEGRWRKRLKSRTILESREAMVALYNSVRTNDIYW
jgi:hypothetical protein